MKPPARVAVVSFFADGDDVTTTISDCLRRLGYQAARCTIDALPPDVDALFSHGPLGRLQRITAFLERLPDATRPRWIHWNTENPPDLRLPWRVMLLVGRPRARFDRLHEVDSPLAALPRLPLVRWLDHRLHKFRYLGEYTYAIQRGVMSVLADYSSVYCALYRSHGVPCVYAPWGLLEDAHAALDLERDLDVLWIGKRRTRRRSRRLDRLRAALSKRGATMHVVDGIEAPLVFGATRTALFNRAVITVNLHPTWYDGALCFRFPLAAANRSLVISDRALPHIRHLRPSVHYVETSADQLADTILHYLRAPAERAPIVEAAYRSVVDEHPLIDSVAAIMQAAPDPIATAR